MCEKLDIQLNEIPDWSCCTASIGYAEGGDLPRHADNARNIALSEKHNDGQDIDATCAVCWIGAKESQERLDESSQLMADTMEVLKEVGLHVDFKNEVPIRHMVEALIEDIDYEGMADSIMKPLESIKFAGHVGCQTNRPFGIDGESFENPMYLDKMVETVGAEPIEEYDQKVAEPWHFQSQKKGRRRSKTSSSLLTTTVRR